MLDDWSAATSEGSLAEQVHRGESRFYRMIRSQSVEASVGSENVARHDALRKVFEIASLGASLDVHGSRCR